MWDITSRTRVLGLNVIVEASHGAHAAREDFIRLERLLASGLVPFARV
jgi:hypothetical protein